MTSASATTSGRRDRSTPPAARRPELVVVDAAVPEPDVLAGLAARPCRLVRLAAGADGLGALLEAVRDAGPVAALHVVAHGSAGRLRLGRSEISAAGLRHRQRAFAALATALGGAPVLLYGCEVGAGAGGRRFVAALAAALGAPVRASGTPVGSAALGGAWGLDIGSGAAAPLFDATRSAGWRHVLANTDVTTAGDLTASLESANSGDTVTLTTDGGAYAMNAAAVESVTLLLGGAVSSATVTPNNAAFAIQPNTNVSSTLTVQADAGQTLTLNTLLADQGTGQLSLTKTGTGTLILGNSSASTNTGAITVSAGTLRVAGGLALSDSGAVSVAAGATLDINGSTETIGTLSGAGDVTLGAGTLTVSQAAAGTFSGDVSGSGNLVKTGAGTLTLSGGNSLTGTTTVSAGTLNVTGGIGGAVSVASGATLTGACSISGALSVASGGTLAPGGSPGTVASGNLTLAAGSALNAEVNGSTPGTDYDQLAVTGTVDVSGANLTTTFGFASTVGDSFVLVANDGVDAVTGTFAGLSEGATISSGGRSYRISYAGDDGNDIVLTDITSPGRDDGSSVVFGSPEADRIVASGGADTIDSGGGADTVSAGSGNDSVRAGTGADIIYGNQGDDILRGEDEDDTLYGGQDRDVVYGNQGDDVAYGNLAADTLFGGRGDDIVYGNPGADLLQGNLGADTLYGGQGTDTLSGGNGDDRLAGGLGADRHAFGSGDGADTVSDFSAAGGDFIAVAANANGTGVATVSDLLARLTADANGDVVLDLGSGNTVTLMGVPFAAATADWFLVA